MGLHIRRRRPDQRWAGECPRPRDLCLWLDAGPHFRQKLFGKWGALDIIVSILVGANLSRALTGQAPLLGTMVATSLLILCHWLLTTAATHSPRLSRLFEGQAMAIVADGCIDERARKRERISWPDIDEALHGAGLKTIDEVHRMTIEPSGAITVIKRKPPP